tara:strand:- start:708 stop:1754 length:1047 start_codon:yes stop_codon:yes gene_type:complete
MNFKKLGNTDLKVSSLCLGTMTWGEQNNQKEAFEQMDFSFEKGINFFDTAEIYPSPCYEKTYGLTEKIIGNWLKEKKNRHKIILATKIAGPGLSWIRGGGPQYSEKLFEKAIDDSLKRLQTNYIDLYQLHWPERKTNFFGKLGFEHQEKSKTEKWNKFEAILQILKNKVNEGKIRHIGISNETSWGLSKFIEVSKLHDLPGVISIQNPYNFLNRTFEIGLAEISIRDQISLLGYSPLAGGYLTGKYRNGQFPKKSRMSLYLEYYPRYRKPNAEEAIEKYWKISKEYNLDFAQMAIKFCEIQKFLGSVIIGATSMEQLKINIESVSVNLTKEILNKINNVQIKYPNPCP